ncbi:MAG: hypothetical protein GY846_21645 [Deltaproteobacteria bacterium]|nr:hypothetical protein [Deltaproteobacteria bacterium]
MKRGMVVICLGVMLVMGLYSAAEADRFRPASPGPGHVWVKAVDIAKGVVVPGFWRPKMKSGFSWNPGYRDDGGHWAPGHWKPVKKFRKGMKWVPGRRHHGRWHPGRWRKAGRPGYFWTGGHWNRRGDWVRGHWRPKGKPHKGKKWVPGHWGKRGHWVPGHWRYLKKRGHGWSPGHYNKRGVWKKGYWKRHAKGPKKARQYYKKKGKGRRNYKRHRKHRKHYR